MSKKKLIPYQMITVYQDWENEKIPIGTALLLKKVRSGLPFILKDMEEIKVPKTVTFYEEKITTWELKKKPLTSYNLYSYEKWLVFIVKSDNSFFKEKNTYTLNIRYFIKEVNDSELASVVFDDLELTEEDYIKYCKNKNKIIDKFMEIDGIELF